MKKTSADMELSSVFTLTLKIYLYSYRNIYIFIAAKHEKQLWQLFKFV